jgi:hypothetical protein
VNECVDFFYEMCMLQDLCKVNKNYEVSVQLGLKVYFLPDFLCLIENLQAFLENLRFTLFINNFTFFYFITYQSADNFLHLSNYLEDTHVQFYFPELL